MVMLKFTCLNHSTPLYTSIPPVPESRKDTLKLYGCCNNSLRLFMNMDNFRGIAEHFVELVFLHFKNFLRKNTVSLFPQLSQTNNSLPKAFLNCTS